MKNVQYNNIFITDEVIELRMQCPVVALYWITCNANM